MLHPRNALLLAFLLAPICAFAHGEEVLLTPLILFGSLLFFFILVIAVRLPYATKAILVAAYLLTTVILFCCLMSIPYRDNMELINLTIGVGPLMATLVTYLVLMIREKQRRSE